ncbi:hypothetical protein EGY25_06480 [Brevundimonas intermedia]|uniref:Uncharacterized protein n=1 Tax=Brevundimonas intermedia TaxID=74315 RepID=A0A4Y9RS53_9CAUL|nr:hypothetical protein EGY25_06480 [Brevundimonas intermedia]
MPQTSIHGLEHEQLGRLLVPFERLNAGACANDHLAFRETQRFKAIGLPAPEAAPDGARRGSFTRLLFTDIPQDTAQIFRDGPKALAISLSPSATLKMDQTAEGVGSFSAFQTLKIDLAVALPAQKRVIHRRQSVRRQITGGGRPVGSRAKDLGGQGFTPAAEALRRITAAEDKVAPVVTYTP